MKSNVPRIIRKNGAYTVVVSKKLPEEVQRDGILIELIYRTLYEEFAFTKGRYNFMDMRIRAYEVVVKYMKDKHGLEEGSILWPI